MLKIIRTRNAFGLFLLLGILATIDLSVGRHFFVQPSYAGQSCEDLGFLSYCFDCPEDKTCEPVTGIEAICYKCRDKRRCEDLGLLNQSSCDNCTKNDPKMTCVSKSRDDYAKPCFECRKKREEEIDCAFYGLKESCPDKNQKCQPLTKSAGKRKITCCECVKKRNCGEDKLLTQKECSSCVKDPKMICAPRGKDEYDQTCFECRKKNCDEVDCEYYGQSSKCPTCPEGETCSPPLERIDCGRSFKCYTCIGKNRCEDFVGLSDRSICDTCLKDPTMICAPRGKDDYGQPCFECRKKQGEEINCRFYSLSSQCQSCPGNQKCEPEIKDTGKKKLTCYRCVTKRSCKDKELLTQRDCVTCMDNPRKKCVPQDKDDYGETCFKCIDKVGKDTDCVMFGLQSNCDSCGRNMKCEAVTKDNEGYKITCYKCKPRRSCRDMELLYDPECAACRKDPANICAPEGKDDYGKDCFKCRKKVTRIDCSQHNLKSKCSACSKDAKCVPVVKDIDGTKFTCYDCQKKRRCPDLGLMSEHDCATFVHRNPGSSCVLKGTDDFGHRCFEFREKITEIDCRQYGLASKCRDCGEGVKCVPVVKDIDGTKFTCYDCQQLSHCRDFGLLDESECTTCIDSPSNMCVPKGKSDWGPCFECRKKQSCADYKTYADCKACSENESCVDAKLKGMACYKCAPKTETRPPPGPPTGEVSRGSTGVTIVIECIQGRVLIKIYNSRGREVAVINRQSLQANNRILHDSIRQAAGGGSGQGSRSAAADSAAAQSNPGNVTALNPNIADSQMDALADSLKESLEKNRDCKKFCDALKGVAGVDFCEENYIRDVQEDKAQVIPNDPFYFDPADHKGLDIKSVADAIIKTATGSDKGTAGFSKPKDYVCHDQWGMHAVGFTPYSDPHSAWKLVDAEKKNIIVAVIDSGFDVTHPDGPRYLWTNPKEIPGNLKDDDGNGYVDDVHGWNFLAENSDLTDFKGHGTFVAGIIAAKVNNGIAIAGINPGAQVMVLKVGDPEGEAASHNIYRALRYAADNGARVINISLASKGISALEQRGIDYAFSQGCIIVVAAGNQSSKILDYGPPASRKVIAVAAAAPTIRRIWSSNIGANVSLTAPGVGIYSLYSQDSQWTGPVSLKRHLCYKADGTSFAAPFVTATASLLLVKNPQLSNTEVEDIILDTATDIEEEGWDQYTGAGLLNAYAALSNTQKRILTVRFMDLVVNREQKEVASVDVYGVVRGDGVRYTVELAKGTKSDQWEKVFESAAPPSPDGFLCRIDGQKLKRGKEWSLRITAEDRSGKSKTARLSFSLD